MLYKRVVLLGGTFCQRLEPVGIVRDAILRSPLLHAYCHSVGNVTVQTGTVLYHVNHLLVHVLRQVFVHFLTVKYFFAEILSRTLTGCFYVERLLLERLSDNLKS